MNEWSNGTKHSRQTNRFFSKFKWCSNIYDLTLNSCENDKWMPRRIHFGLNFSFNLKLNKCAYIRYEKLKRTNQDVYVAHHEYKEVVLLSKAKKILWETF